MIAARLDAARALLADSDLPIGRIAEELGYADVYRFSKQFATKVGMAPSTWRTEQRESPTQ